MPGWSNLIPTPMVPSPPLSPLSPPPPGLAHAASARDAAAIAAPARSTRLNRITVVFLPVGHRPPVLSTVPRWGLVGQDFAEEVLGAGGFRVGEEVVGGGVLDDLAVGHEHDAVGGFAREPHLVGDHEHRHALPGQGG